MGIPCPTYAFHLLHAVYPSDMISSRLPFRGTAFVVGTEPQIALWNLRPELLPMYSASPCLAAGPAPIHEVTMHHCMLAYQISRPFP